jgi:hypothetical protein
MQRSDLPAVARELELHPTVAAGMFFANASTFYGTRVEIRKNILGRLMPDLPRLARLLPQAAGAGPDDRAIERIGAERLAALKRESTGAGSRLVLLLPPMLTSQDHAEAVQAAGKTAGVPVILAIRSGTLKPDDFTDGFHLSQSGAAQFTERIIPYLIRELEGAAR